MGDGSPIKSGGLVLCTDSYSIQDVVRLMNVLIIRYKLKCTIHNPNIGQYRNYIDKKSVQILRPLICPHMVPSLLYKLHM